MANGTVTATSLNLRDTPGGNVVGVLIRGTSLSILGQQSNWLHVSTPVNGQTDFGWVSADWITPGVVSADTVRSAPIPPPDDPSHPVKVQGYKAVGPDGTSFATVWKSGFVTYGNTFLIDWLQTNSPSVGTSQSTVRVVRAASLNEGKLEAINSWDDAFFSFGMLQWTAGTDNTAGELAALLDRLQRTDANCFQEYFGKYQLNVQVPASRATTGFITLNGSLLQSPAAKAQLRAPEWAYRFWRAGHDDQVRQCELGHAAARIAQFFSRDARGRPVSDWLTSEYGIALVLDEHVNRPTHVPNTLERAIDQLPPGTPSPSNWGDAQEAALIQLYIEARNSTDMTNPQPRAAQIADCLHDGSLSDRRGSFQYASGQN